MDKPITIKKYIEDADPCKFIRLSSGRKECLLDDAIVKMERYKKGLEAIKQHLEIIGEYNGMKPTSYTIACKYLEEK